MRASLPRALPAVSWASAMMLVQVGCVSSAGLEEELSRVRRELVALRKDLSETQGSLKRLEGQVTLLSLGREGLKNAPETEVASSSVDSGAPAKNRPRASSRGQTTNQNRVLPVVRLSSHARVADSDEDWMDPGAVDDGSPPVVIALSGQDAHGEERLPVDREVLKKPDPVLHARSERTNRVPAEEATSVAIEAEYARALERLRRDRAPEDALKMFEAFRAEHPRSNLADNAAFWSGECHAAMGAHEKAIAELEGLVRDFPRSSKRPDALQRIGESWVALGQRDKAGAAFKQVIDSYPKTEAAGRARARLAELGADGGK